MEDFISLIEKVESVRDILYGLQMQFDRLIKETQEWIE
jgi:hypothetical protein